VLTVDPDFIPQFDIKMAAGRTFSQQLTSDQKGAYILNQSAVKHLGFTSPEEALGKTMKAHYHRLTKKVIGITRDFYYQGMQDEVEPLVLDIENSLMESIILSVDTTSLTGTLPFIEETWGKHFPGAPFEFYFLDEEFSQLYQYEERMGKLLGMVTLLAVTIACLGLLGLVAFSAQIRQREIGIRKVLGASVVNIVSMMSKQFVRLVVLASILALPAAWYVMNLWLKDFAYRIHPGFLVFLLSALSALVISLITIAYQAGRVARQNPIESIRCQ
jgi:putative ABC transport system permease protein